MANKQSLILVLSLIVLGILVSTSCGCIETSSATIQTGNSVFGASIVEHEYLFGLMESKYDAMIWVMGANVVNVQGIKESDLDRILNQYQSMDTSSSSTSSASTSSSSQSGVVYYQPTSTPVKSSNVVYSNNVVYTSVDMAASSMEIVGDVYGLDGNNGGRISTIRFNVGINSGGQAIDFRNVQAVFATVNSVEILGKSSPMLVSSDSAISSGEWAILKSTSSADFYLKSGETFTIFVKPSNSLGTNTKFNLELRPSEGSPIGLKRTTPPKIDSMNLLY